MENSNLLSLERTSLPEADFNMFVHQTNRGKNGWWRYALSIFIILTTWQVIGAFPYALTTWLKLNSNVFVNYLGISFSFVLFFLSILVTVRLIHQRPSVSLVNPSLRINSRLIISGFVVWFVISGLITLVDAWIHSGSYQWTMIWPGWLWFTVIAIPLTSIQTFAEELFFRGYLLQGFARSIHSRWWLGILSGIIFAIPHFLNPEMQAGFIPLALFYFAFGFFLTWITLESNSLELAMGVHAANNLFAVVIANYKGSALQSISLFTSNGIDPLFNLISLLVGVGIFFWWIRTARFYPPNHV